MTIKEQIAESLAKIQLGDTVYCVICGEIRPFKVEGIEVKVNEYGVFVDVSGVYCGRLGNDVFLSQEEAIKKIKGEAEE